MGKNKILILTIIALIIMGFEAVVINRTMMRLADQQTKSLILQLRHLRTGVALYLMMNKKNPASFADLNSLQLDERISSNLDFELYPTDDKGNILDSFGNSLVMDPNTGWIKTTTNGFENF